MFKRPLQVRSMQDILLAVLLTTVGCASNHISRPDRWAPASTMVESRTVWTFFWGIGQQNINPTNCLGPGMAEVIVDHNLGYSLISVLSLGTAMPVRIEWRCAKDKPTGGDDF